MNRYVGIGFGLIIIAGIVAVFFFLHPAQPTAPAGGGTPVSNTPTPISTYTVTTPTSIQTAQAVTTAFDASLSGQNPDQIKPQTVALSGGWALQAWSGAYTSGEALMRYDAGKGGWVVVSMGGGVWNVADLVRLGVPQKTVLILFSDLYASH